MGNKAKEQLPYTRCLLEMVHGLTHNLPVTFSWCSFSQKSRLRKSIYFKASELEISVQYLRWFPERSWPQRPRLPRTKALPLLAGHCETAVSSQRRFQVLSILLWNLNFDLSSKLPYISNNFLLHKPLFLQTPRAEIQNHPWLAWFAYLSSLQLKPEHPPIFPLISIKHQVLVSGLSKDEEQQQVHTVTIS